MSEPRYTSEDAPTRELPVADSMPTDEPTLAFDAVDLPPLDDASDDEWVTAGGSRGIRLRVPTAILAVLLVAAGGVWAGAELQKTQDAGSSSATGGFPSALRGAGAGGPAAFGGVAPTGESGGSVPTTGTVSVVNGNTVYVLASDGSVVEVTLTKATTVTRNAAADAKDLKPGDTVVVTGETGKEGEVVASSVSATAEGVTPAGRGNFNGFAVAPTGTSGNGG